LIVPRALPWAIDYGLSGQSWAIDIPFRDSIKPFQGKEKLIMIYDKYNILQQNLI
jgi:hypothetical protein